MGVYAELESEFDFEIVEEFLSHFIIMIEPMEKLVIGLKNEASFSDNINQLFRTFHNIKSATGYLKIKPINTLVTLVEEVLEECRLVEGEGSEALVSWLILVCDQLSDYRDDLENDVEKFCVLNHRIIKVPVKFTV